MRIKENKEWTISVDRVSKKFGLSLQRSMKYGLRDTCQRLIGITPQTEKLRADEFWALNDVSFNLMKGQAMGIMGVNGSGKTTLLRILNGVFSPDSGSASLRGRVGAMIAAGAGFAPMLSGRENIYINASLLGLSSKEISLLLDDIVEFSELQEFIDMPVKNYSSGMYVRLGFAIAAFSHPDILLMDEVLAVGDMNFQKKCFEHILKLKENGTSIILVSHSQGAIWSVCDRALFMDKGRIILDGAVEDVIRAYDDKNSNNAMISSVQFASRSKKTEDRKEKKLISDYGHTKGGTDDISCESVRTFESPTMKASNEFDFSKNFLIESIVRVNRPQFDLLLRFTIDAAHYKGIATLDSYEQGLALEKVVEGTYRLIVEVKNPNFRPGNYTLNVGISRKSLGVHLFYWFGASHFIIKHPKSSFLYAEHNAVMHLESSFSFENVLLEKS